MKIIALGDVHGKFKELNALIQIEKPDLILQCGDFGFWPGQIDINTIENHDTVICFCDGNHENHDKLDELTQIKGRNPIEVIPNVLYCPRGSYIKLPDGRRVLFMGGAMSRDKHLRREGYNWFSQEVITAFDIKALPEIDIDIVVSHTAPIYFTQFSKRWTKLVSEDVTSLALNYIYEKYKPSLWFFGHWHTYKKGLYKNCTWVALNREKQANWWIDINKV